MLGLDTKKYSVLAPSHNNASSLTLCFWNFVLCSSLKSLPLGVAPLAAAVVTGCVTLSPRKSEQYMLVQLHDTDVKPGGGGGRPTIAMSN